MTRRGRDKSRGQRQLRRRRGERAFLFDKNLDSLLGDADRDEWEFAISVCGGNVAAAARWCGLGDVPRGAKALWGRSAEEALATYRRWEGKRPRR